MIVLDAAAAADFLLPRQPQHDWVERRILSPGEMLHAPHLLDLEVTNAVRSWVVRRELSEQRGRAALLRLHDLAIVRHPHPQLVDRIWELRNVLTVYDAAYIALAEALDCPLVTTDQALGRVAGHGARVEVFPG